jgi:hypothetical protein
MKKTFIITIFAFAFTSCGIFNRSSKTGCPSNGKNVGAEKLLSGDAKAIKQANKASKFKGGW